MTEFIKYPSIEQFRNVIKHVQHKTWFAGLDEDGSAIYDKTRPLPTLWFYGLPKAHGTNAGIVYWPKTDTFTYQSRQRTLTLNSDNSEFMFIMSRYEDEIRAFIVGQIGDQLEELDSVAIFGEWSGKGIQKGVAVSELEKSFLVFAMRTQTGDMHEWITADKLDFHSPEHKIYNLDYIKNYAIQIDFNKPEVAQNKIIEWTLEIEQNCPIGEHFGISGIGEGVVFYARDYEYWGYSGTLFKSKGEKHQTSRVKTLKVVDVEAIENMNNLLEAVLTEARLEWALDNLVREQQLPIEMSSMGQFIRTCYADIIKEDLDVLQASGVSPKSLGGPVANKARPWFIKKVNEKDNA